jgi:hypothetical protein
MADVSLTLLPNLHTELAVYPLLQILVTAYRGHALRGNERLIGPVAHEHASWNMSKRAWVHAFA